MVIDLWQGRGHCQHCQLQSLHGVCFGCSFFSPSDSKVFCIRFPATSMSGGCGQGSFWPNFAPKKEDDKSDADEMAVATQKSEDIFEDAEGQSENETPEVEVEVEKSKKPPRNSKAKAELLNAKPKPKAKAASGKAKAKAKAAKAAPKRRAAAKKDAKAAAKGKAKGKAKSKSVKRPAGIMDSDGLEASSEHEKAVDAESSAELEVLSEHGSDATATTLPLTPRAGSMQSDRKSKKPKDKPQVEVDKSSGCSKCRWSKRGCGKCRGATK